MKISRKGISLRRWVAFVVGGIIAILFLFHGSTSKWLAVLASIGFTLGITDYGRQCPLMLSVQHILARLKKKKQSN